MQQRRKSKILVLATTIALVSTTLTGWAPMHAVAAACGPRVPGDINGDGHADVVVSEPSRKGGTLHVFYGHPSGLVVDATGTALDDQVFHQDTPGVPGTAGEEDNFGLRNVLADFNGDGCADLASGVLGDSNLHGSVVVLYGSPRGITTAGAQSFSATSVFGSGTTLEAFGAVVTPGDLDDDGVTDLVIGLPGGATRSQSFGGAVVVLHGSARGLNRGRKATLLNQSSPGVPGTPAEDDGFGASLATGDFNGNGVDDLAIGVPGDNKRSGTVTVLPGSAGHGIGRLAGASLSQDTSGVPGKAEPDDSFGSAVSAGDVTGDGRADLAVGVSFENGRRDGDGYEGAGAVAFLPGSAAGLTGRGSQSWTQDSPGVDGAVGRNDQFGSALVIAPLDAGRHHDLAIAAVADAVGRVGYAGSVTLLLGTSSGLSTKGAGGQRLTQDTPGVSGVPESIDFFSGALAAPRIQSRAQSSLVVGAFGETIGNVEMAGVVHQLDASATGPTGTGSRTFHLDSPGVKGRPSAYFGYDVS